MANCFDLAVPGRIILGDDPVGAFRDDLAILDDDGAEHAAGIVDECRLGRELDRAPHELPMLTIAQHALVAPANEMTGGGLAARRGQRITATLISD